MVVTPNLSSSLSPEPLERYSPSSCIGRPGSRIAYSAQAGDLCNWVLGCVAGRDHSLPPGLEGIMLEGQKVS